MAGQSSNLKPGVEPWTPEQQMQELKKRMGTVMAIFNSQKKVDLSPSEDDFLIVVPPKHGTTWLLHVCHQIRMKGAESDFEDQMEVISLIEAHEMLFGVKPQDQKQPASPRLYATHLPFPLVPEGGKRIFSFRDPKDVVVSAYHFLNSGLALKGRVALPMFAHAYIQQIEKQLNDLLMRWEHRNDKDILLIFFDDLKEDHTGTVRRIAKYLGVELDDDAIARVVHTTSHAEMSRHASKFNLSKVAKKMSEMIGEELETDSEDFVGRVRKDGGKSGEGKQKLPVEVQQCIDQMWQEIVTSKLGFKNLQEMHEAWKKERTS